MNLLDDSVYGVAALLGVVAVVGGGVLTALTPRRRWQGVLINAAVVALAAALVASGLFLVLNRQNAWYGSLGEAWADAAGGRQPVGPDGAVGDETAGAGATAPSDVYGKDHQARRTDARVLAPLPSPGQRVQVFDVPTADGRASWPVTVVLPTDYFDAGSAQRAYPVLMAGHGIPGNREQYLAVIDIRTYGDPAVQAKKIAPFITVIPSITPGGQDTECIFGPGGATQLETWLANDVPAFVKGRLRTIQERTGWAWTGFSGGAYCAAMITMRHPDTFAAAAMLGGYYRPEWGKAKPPWPAGSAQDKEYDLIALAASRPPAVALWVQTSQRDPESWPDTQRFLAAAKSPTLVTAVIDTTGGHSWKVWLPHMSGALEWLGTTVPGFAP